MANSSGNAAGDRDDAEGASGSERLSAPPVARTPRLAFPVVGVGASAGGLEAYIEFLQATPADTGMAFVLVQHLPPDRESMLVELLASHTLLPVLEAKDGQEVAPDHVYVIRPGSTLTIGDGRLHLGPVLAARGHGRPVDDFFRSLAEEQQQRAVAVVFSGMGSNGTAGAQAVKAVGGLVIAQEPDSARYPAMPRSLIDAHVADFILRPAEVSEALAKYAGQAYVANDTPAPASVRDEQALADVLAVLRTRTRHDFTGYRKPTLLRRIRRRMGLGQISSMAEYVSNLRQTPAEVSALADDLLIHVTGFFRDPEAWVVLRDKAIDPLVADRPDGAEIRCWVSACATGEEAYSLAMLLIEAAEAAGKRFDIKVFATDMAERALGSARAGLFPNGIESEVTPERLARFFDKDDSFYRVKKELRELVIFAPQNILHDPPFSRLDIATCRNLLIYLEPERQRRVLAALHFGLREGGTLLLGNSESVGPAEVDFEAIDKRHRLFRRVGPTRPGGIELQALTSSAREFKPAAGQGGAQPLPVAQVVARTLLDRYTPPAVAVDGTGQVIHVHGNTGPYLSLPTGSPSLDLLHLANDNVRGAVRMALHRATDTQSPFVVRDGLIDTPAGRMRIEVSAVPLAPRGSPPVYLVTFRDVPEPPPTPAIDGDAQAAGQMASDLERARSELQGALEEMQTTNEELKASHEEATSLNEELQSTNEELETSKEEMQSLNEELVTLNTQLQTKMSELEATANDLSSLLTSTDIAVLFLDPAFRIRRFTPAVLDLLDLIPSDVGRPLADLRRKFTDPDMMADAHAVLVRLIPVEREVASESGRTYLRRVLPYRTQDNRIDGVVVAFVDVTDRRLAEAAVRSSEEKYRTLFETMGEGFAVGELVRDAAGRAVDWRLVELNRAFERHTGMKVEESIDVPFGQLCPGVDHGEWLALYQEVVDGQQPRGFERHWPPLDRWLSGNAYPAGEDQFVVILTDVTARKQTELFLKASEERQAFLLRLSDALRPLSEPDAIQLAAMRVLGRHLRLAGAEYIEAEANDEWLVSAGGYSDGAPLLARRVRAVDLGRALKEALRTGRTVAVVGDDPVTDDAAPADDGDPPVLRAFVGVPLIKGGRFAAGLVVHHNRLHEWSSDELSLIEETAEHVWVAVERARAEAALRTSEAWLAGQKEAFQAAVNGAPLAVSLGVLVRTAVAQAGPGVRGAIYIADQAKAELHHVVGMSEADAECVDGLKIGPDSLACGLAAYTGVPVIVVDVTKSSRWKRWEWLAEKYDYRGCWSFPIETAAGEIVGTFALYFVAPRDATDRDREFAAVLTQAAAIIISRGQEADERARTARELREARDRLEERVSERTAELAATVDSLESEMAHRRELALRLSSAQEDERMRVSRDLHDTVGQTSVALALALAATQETVAPGSEAAERLAYASRLAQGMSSELRDLALRLRPTALDDLGLTAALHSLVDAWTEQHGVPVALAADLAERLPPEVETALYRVVQEALTNVSRHAGAAAVRVAVSRQPGSVTAVVEDDGVGFDTGTTDTTHLGLRVMQERLTMLGGDLVVESQPGAGARIVARMPLDE